MNNVVFLRNSLITFFLFMSVMTVAQIKRNIDGVVLGVSTKQNVINHLKTKGLPCKYIEGGNVIMSFKDNSFGGVMWFAIYYRFHKGIVYKITYSKYANNSDVFISSIDSEYSNLKNSLLRKYRPYLTESKYERLLPNTIVFNDRTTEVELGKGYYEGSYLLNLIYTDTHLQEKNYESDYNDL